LAGDHFYFDQFSKSKQQTTELLRDFANAYQVSRTIPKPNCKGQVDPIICVWNSVCDALNNWPQGLIPRAERCVKIAEAHSKAHNVSLPLSAISKIVWFVQPDGWTMYDRFARAALGIKGIGKESFIAFYEAVEANKFSEKVSEINKLIGSSGLSLHGSRIYDKSLWLRGSKQGASADRAARDEGFLNLLPEAQQSALIELAEGVNKILV
jgi:hypothetical protein